MSDIPPPLLPEHQLAWAQEDLRRCRRRRRWLFIFFLLSLGLNVLFYLGFAMNTKEKKVHEHGSVFSKRFIAGDEEATHKIAVVRVEGLISKSVEGHMGYDGMVADIKEQLRLAVEDEEVRAIILRIDSPGGEVLASDELYRAVKQARAKKPVVCSMGSLAASGGYYTAMGATYVMADELTITGSIGVIMQTMNYKDLFGKIGLRSYVFKSGKFKDIMNGSREPSQEEMDLLQNLIMETYDQFLNIVATERKLDATMLRETLADGRVLSGRQALAAKLVDENGTFDDAIAKAKKLADIPSARVEDYVVPFSLGNLLGIFSKAGVPKIQIDLPPNVGIQLQQGKMYFLSTNLF